MEREENIYQTLRDILEGDSKKEPIYRVTVEEQNEDGSWKINSTEEVSSLIVCEEVMEEQAHVIVIGPQRKLLEMYPLIGYSLLRENIRVTEGKMGE